MSSEKRSRSWRAKVVGLAVSGLITFLLTSGVRAAPTFNLQVDSDKATTAGNINVHVDFIDAAGRTQNRSIPVPVAVGDDRTMIRDAISKALAADATITGSFTLSKDDKGFGAVELSVGTANAKVTVTDAYIANTGGIKGPTLGGGSLSALIPPVGGSFFSGSYAFFTLTGTVGTANDVLSVVLDKAGDNFSKPDFFTLPSYSGMDPLQANQGLVNLIDKNSNYNAMLVGDTVRIIGDLDPQIAAEIVLTGTASNLTGNAGIVVTSIPEPAALIMFSIGTLGVLGYSRRRRKWAAA